MEFASQQNGVRGEGFAALQKLFDVTSNLALQDETKLL